MQDSFEHFTPRARWAVSLAQEEAARLGHDYVSVDLLLLGVLKLGAGGALTALWQLGVDFDALRGEIETFAAANVASPVHPASSVIPAKAPIPISYTPRVKKVFSLASKESASLGRRQVGSEHLILGILREGHSEAARLLGGRNVNSARFRQAVERALGSSKADREEAI
jgi:ATP-dependent Clp protease ATP-binding subunit ClpC